MSGPLDPAATPPTPGVSAWNVANALTALRLVLVPVFGVMLLHEDGQDLAWRIAAAGVFLVAVFTDRLDGELARSRGLVTDIGKIADPIADKALMGTALVGLSIIGELPWWVTIVILLREIGITILRFVVIRHGVMPAGRGGKVKTAVQSLAIGLFVLPLTGWGHDAAWIVMLVAVVVTVVTGVDYVVQARRLVASSDRTARKRAERAASRPAAVDRTRP